MPNEIIIAAQNETIRAYEKEAVDLATVGLISCNAWMLLGKGRSLTHADRRTDPSFIVDEVDWLQSNGSQSFKLVIGMGNHPFAQEDVSFFLSFLFRATGK